MNYGKESLSKKKKNVSSKKNMKKKRVGVRVFKAVVMFFRTVKENGEDFRAIGDEVFGELLRGGEIDAAVGFHRGDHSRQNAAERC